MKKQSILGLVLASTFLLTGTGYSEPGLFPLEEEPKEIKEVTEIKVYPTGDRFTKVEQTVLNFFVDRGITDKMALAAILGNIKAESLFHPNICEGGARVPYHQCHRGGFGLIQWTTINRYRGLGEFAKKYGGDPSSLDTQLRYLVNEYQWQKIESKMKTPGMKLSYYMDAAYYWLGWGIHGNRTHYANDYYARLT